MPFLVEHLLEGRSHPITAVADEQVRSAIQRMVEHDFSQLPVIDADDNPIGMITSDSIVRALNNFGCTTDDVHVYDAMVPLEERQKFKSDEDLFDLLDDLRDAYAAVIVDREGKLTGIVTTYDTTEYFRRRAEDMMLAREIEKTIKDYILESFKDANGNPDEAAINNAIVQITPSNRKLRKPFGEALTYYVHEKLDQAATLDEQFTDDIFMQFLGVKASEFEDLTLSEYITLFLHKARWDRYKSVFTVDMEHIRKLLESVRNTRNDLSHLRDDLTAQQRDELQFCHKWLARHERKLLDVFRAPTTASQATDGTELSGSDANRALTDEIVAQPEEELAPKDSRYAPLALFLQQQPLEQEQLTLPFRQLEEIIQDTLPESARRQRQFWANDSVGHVQSQLWLDAGWRVSRVNLTEEVATFTRIAGRQKAYIDFFSALLTELRNVDNLHLGDASPMGWHWQTIARIPYIGAVGFAFTLQRRARVELYIDTGEKEQNKVIFDALHARREAIESMYGSPLAWERIDQKRASRIASYRRGAISDSADELAELRAWGIDAVQKFYPLLDEHVKAVLATLEAVAKEHNRE